MFCLGWERDPAVDGWETHTLTVRLFLGSKGVMVNVVQYIPYTCYCIPSFIIHAVSVPFSMGLGGSVKAGFVVEVAEDRSSEVMEAYRAAGVKAVDIGKVTDDGQVCMG